MDGRGTRVCREREIRRRRADEIVVAAAEGKGVGDVPRRRRKEHQGTPRDTKGPSNDCEGMRERMSGDGARRRSETLGGAALARLPFRASVGMT